MVSWQSVIRILPSSARIFNRLQNVTNSLLPWTADFSILSNNCAQTGNPISKDAYNIHHREIPLLFLGVPYVLKNVFLGKFIEKTVTYSQKHGDLKAVSDG